MSNFLLRPAVLISLIFFSVLFTGCLGLNPFCGGSSCPPGQTRDSFCGCIDLRGTPTPVPPTPPTTLSSACICKLPGGQSEAWFTYAPSGFNSLAGKHVSVFANRCIDLTTCPMLEGADRCYADGDKPQQCILTGTFDLTVQRSTVIESLINGHKSWALIGNTAVQTANRSFRDWLIITDINKQGTISRLMDVDWKLAGAMVGEIRLKSPVSAVPSGLKWAPADSTQCEVECAKKGPFCVIAKLEDLNGLVKAVDRARTMLSVEDGKTIKKTDFMNAFGQADDECKRSDTTITAGVLQNTGNGCWLSSTVVRQQDTGLYVHLPPKLVAKRAIESQSLVFTFDDATEAPLVKIGDEDLDQQFGGDVQRVSANVSGGIISTSRGCIAIQVK